MSPLHPVASSPPHAPSNTDGSPVQEVHHHDSPQENKEKKLKELGEIDPASLIPGKGPGGVPQQFFVVSP